MNHDTKYLFSPFKMGNLLLDNRIIGAATVTNLGRFDGNVNDRMVALYARRAAGGAALITIEMTATHPTGKGMYYLLGSWDDRFIPGHRKLVDVIHSHGRKCSLQLGHCGPQTTRAIIGTRPVAPSSLSQFPLGHPQYVLPRALSGGEIEEIIKYTSDAAYRAMQTGFDAVELHGAHGYLFHQFLSPAGNIRDDKYGGSTTNRCRILTDIVGKIKKKCGPNFCIICKIDGNEHIENGIKLEEATKVAKLLENAGVDALLISAGCAVKVEYIIPPGYIKSAPYAYEASEIKKAVKIPVGVVGKIDDLTLADRLIGNHNVDYIALARSLLCDPELPTKARQGKWDQIRRCIYCNEKCNRVDDQYAVGCVLNPVLGHESESDYQVRPTTDKKKIIVIGGGPAGLEAARAAATRGHNVHLLEKSTKLGGQVNLTAKIPGKETRSSIIPYYEKKLSHLGVNIECGKNSDIHTLRALNPEVVIIATGAAPRLEEIAASEDARVITAFEALSNPQSLEKQVIIIGGQRLGVDTALYLASKNKEVTLLVRGENESYITQNITRTLRAHITQSLQRYNIKIIYKASVGRIIKDNIALTIDGTYRELSYKIAIIAMSLKPVLPSFSKEIKLIGCPVYKIGDCVFPRGLGSAISEGFEIGQVL